MSFSDTVRSRRSVRTFTGEYLSADDRESLIKHFGEISDPYGIGVEFKLLDADEHGLQSPVITGAKEYVGAKIKRVPHADEAFGYAFEDLVLFLCERGIGTTIIAGTMNRSAFEKAMELKEGEYMPCITPVGYAAEKMSLRETIMRKGVRADSRLGWESMFFDEAFNTVLYTEDECIRDMLESVRWAPSAVNRQPWRVVKDGNSYHFYCKHSKGMQGRENGDMQKVDLGIALYHFEKAAAGMDLTVHFSISDPGIALPEDTEYIATYTAE